MLQTRRPPRFQPASSRLLVWRDSERKLQNSQRDRPENNAKEFSLVASGFCRSFIFNKRALLRCSVAKEIS